MITNSQNNIDQNYQSTGKRLGETKVGGFFRRLFGAAKHIPGLGAFAEIGDALLDGLDVVIGNNLKIDTDTLTPNEQAILDGWDATKFTPVYLQFIYEMKAVFTAGQPGSSQLTKLNSLSNKMCAIESYFAFRSEPGLSENAVQIRNQYINVSFRAIRETLLESLSQSNIEYTTFYQKGSVTEFNLSPLITGGSIGGNAYSCLNYSLNREASSPTEHDASILEPTFIPGSDHASVPTSTKSSGDGGLWLGVFALSLAAAATLLFSAKNDKPVKAKPKAKAEKK